MTEKRHETAHLQVNSFQIEWTEEAARKELPCRSCAAATRGRVAVRQLALKEATHQAATRPQAYCLACAMRLAMEMGTE